MVSNKNKSSVCAVKKLRKNKDGSTRLVTVGYLSNRDLERGEDIHLDTLGYKIDWLD